MILNIAIYKEGVPEHLEANYDPHELDLEFIDLHYIRKIALKGVAEKVRQTVSFHGIMTSRVEQVCARCLEKIEGEVTAPFDLSYDVHGKETVDITDDLRDILILGHPERFLCRSDCKGICPQCGTNLNHGTCHCQPTNVSKSSSWEQLKIWYRKKGN